MVSLGVVGGTCPRLWTQTRCRAYGRPVMANARTCLVVRALQYSTKTSRKGSEAFKGFSKQLRGGTRIGQTTAIITIIYTTVPRELYDCHHQQGNL